MILCLNDVNFLNLTTLNVFVNVKMIDNADKER